MAPGGTTISAADGGRSTQRRLLKGETMSKIAILAAVAALGLSAAAPMTARAAEPAAQGIL